MQIQIVKYVNFIKCEFEMNLIGDMMIDHDRRQIVGPDWIQDFTNDKYNINNRMFDLVMERHVPDISTETAW